MKNLFIKILLAVGFTAPVMGHEGHGPKLIRSGKYGGVLAEVFSASNRKRINRATANKATDIYIAEFVKDEEGKVFVYLYDQKMTPVPLDRFSLKASSILRTGRGKKQKTTSFFLEKSEMSFTGNLPKNDKRPFSIEIHLIEGNKKLFMKFDHLD